MQTATRPFSAPAPVTPRPSARFPPQPPAAPIARSSVQSDAPRDSQNAGSPASSARVSRRAHAACDSASSAGRAHPARPSRRRARRARPRLCKKSNWASRRGRSVTADAGRETGGRSVRAGAEAGRVSFSPRVSSRRAPKGDPAGLKPGALGSRRRLPRIGQPKLARNVSLESSRETVTLLTTRTVGTTVRDRRRTVCSSA